MNRRELINSLRKKQNEGKRMKKTIPTIFITDDSKENTSLMVKRNVNTKNKKRREVFCEGDKKESNNNVYISTLFSRCWLFGI